MKILLFLIALASCTYGFQQNTDGFRIRVIRESEFGRYDTIYSSSKYLFEFTDRYQTGEHSYPNPKYIVDSVGVDTCR